MKCLIIDDDADDQEIFIMTMEKVNTDVQCYTSDNGVEALHMLETKALIPDYIFLDVNMPKMNGIACLKQIKNLPHLKRTKVFMYSTTSEGSTVEESTKLGATDFIIKPASTTVLKQVLTNLLQQHTIDS
jgi:response regulator of citrate/malate metabolism